MKRLLKTIIFRPVTICTMVVLLLILGVMSTIDSNVNLVPDMNLPYVGIVTTYPGASATAVEKDVTKKTETVLNTISSINSVSAYSLDNVSMIAVYFDYGTDVEKKIKEMEMQFKTLELPDGCDAPYVSQFDINASPIASIAVSKKTEDNLNEVSNDLMEKLYNIEGVGSINTFGDNINRVEIKGLEGLELTSGLIVKTLMKSNLDIPLGTIYQDGNNIALRNTTNPTTIEEIKNLPIKYELSLPIYLAIKKASGLLDLYETSTLNDFNNYVKELEDIQKEINYLDSLTVEKLNEYQLETRFNRLILELLRNNTSLMLKKEWEKIEPFVTDIEFLSLSDDELNTLANKTLIDYDLLKFLHDNADNTGGDVKKLWDILIEYRKIYVNDNDLSYENLVPLFKDGGSVNIDSIDYSFSGLKIYSTLDDEKIVWKLRSCDFLNPIYLRTFYEKVKNVEILTSLDYVLLFLDSKNIKDYPLLANILFVDFINNNSFIDNIKVLKEVKETIVNSEGNPINKDESLYDGNNKNILSDEDYLNLYNKLDLKYDYNLNLTTDIIHLLRNIDFSKTNIDYDNIKASLNLKLDDLGHVELNNTSKTFARYNGKDAVILDVIMAKDGNTSKVVSQIKEIIKKNDFNAEVTLIEDNAEFINDSISNILSSMLIGGVLAIIVIYLFIRKIRSSLIIAVTMPLSILTALIFLWLMNISLNMVSIGGLAVGVGMLVDNSIVVLESITKHREKGEDVPTSCVLGSEEVASSLLASTLTNICVFIPILFIKGLTREIFSDLVYAIIFSMVMSFITAVFVIPTLYHLLYYKKTNDLKYVKGVGKLTSFYEKTLKKTLRIKGIFLIASFFVFISSLLLILTFKMEFLPKIDKGIIEVQVEYEYGTTKEEINNTEIVIENEIKKLDNIKNISYCYGKKSITNFNDKAFIRLEVDNNKVNTTDYANKIRKTVSNVSGIKSVSVQEIDGIVAQLTSSFSSSALDIKTKNYDELRQVSEEIKVELLKDERITNAVVTGTSLIKEVRYHLDLEKCNKNNINYQELIKLLRVGIASYDACSLDINGELMKVNVQFSDDDLSSLDKINNLAVGFSLTGVIKLKDIATIEIVDAPNFLMTSNGDYVSSISVETIGIATGDVTKIMENASKKVLSNHPNVTSNVGGISLYLKEAFEGLAIALIFAFILLYAVMACQFESLIKPFIIVMAIPFGLTGAILSLTLTVRSLNIVSLIGIIMLLGVIVNDAIVMIDKINLNIKEGMKPYEAVIKGATDRLRAVWMTSLTTILALIPLSLGLGRGGTLMQPMGIVVLGGLLVGTVITLYLIPAFYCLIKKIKTKEDIKEDESIG